jgi:putative iron-dependent peroxidase
MNLPVQPGILEGVPAVARYVVFDLAEGFTPEAVREALKRLAALADGQSIVVGVGATLADALGAKVPNLRSFPQLDGPDNAHVPSTPHALWCWVRGDDLGDLLQLTRKLEKALRVRHIVDGFRHKLSADTGHGRDLTGYEDGTENPKGDDAVAAGVAQDGSSCVAVQQWVHDFDAFEALADEARDHHFGRRLVDNEEIEDAPDWAHVKRTAQEDFDPPAFMVRRSMPWLMSRQAGLMFVAFGKDFDAFERQMRRMAGLEDGIVDAMFRISKPVNGAYYWCPPVKGGRVDFSRLGA